MISYTKQSLENLDKAIKKKKVAFDGLFKKLKQLKPQKIDTLFHTLHEEEFNKIDCLECARCCSGLGPLLLQTDIDRMAKKIKMPPSQFYQTYIEMDEDGDYVFNTHPCPFLLADNYCQIYESRPKSCKEYPHTDRRKMKQILNLTQKNALHCPAVFNILTTLNKQV